MESVAHMCVCVLKGFKSCKSLKSISKPHQVCDAINYSAGVAFTNISPPARISSSGKNSLAKTSNSTLLTAYWNSTLLIITTHGSRGEGGGVNISYLILSRVSNGLWEPVLVGVGKREVSYLTPLTHTMINSALAGCEVWRHGRLMFYNTTDYLRGELGVM